MKMRDLVLFLFAPVLFLGCKENPNNEYVPCEEMYSPEGTTISWTEYNDVATFRDYFYCHPATIKEHEGDTIKIKGWLYYGEPQVDARVWHESELDYSPSILLTSNPNHFGYNETVHIRLQQSSSDDSIWSYVRNHLDEFSQKQIYVSCIMGYGDIPPITGCCYRVVNLFAIDINLD